MSSFGPIAPYYDVLMRSVPYEMWASYYLLLLAEFEHRPRRLLDVCCGTGSVAERLQEYGFQVAGIDLSQAMIDEARRKEEIRQRGVRYFQGDVSQMALGETFDGAYSFFDSLNYIVSPEDFRSAIIRVGQHLEPGGSFIFDLNTSYAFEAGLFNQSDHRKKSPIHYEWKGDYDRETRVIRVDMRFWVDGKELREEHVQRAHTHDEVVEALEAAGFGEIHLMQSYTLDPPTPKSDRVHYAARKGPAS